MRYLLLTKNDIIEENDEVLLDDCKTWENVKIYSKWVVGKRYDSTFFVPMRRLIHDLDDALDLSCWNI